MSYAVDEPTLILPSSVIKLEHTSFNLTCKFLIFASNLSSEFPFLTWHDSEGKVLASSNGTEVTLQFTNAKKNMSGAYTCYAYFDSAFNYSDTTHLYIQCKSTFDCYALYTCYIPDGPKITNITSSATLLVNQTLTLYCEAHGDPLPSYAWQHNGYNISHGSMYMYIKPYVTTEDSGRYTCIASNRPTGILMSDNKTIEVTVLSS